MASIQDDKSAEAAFGRANVLVEDLVDGVIPERREQAVQEEATIQKELGRVHGLSQAGIDAICGLLADQISHVALLGDHDWTRDLRDLAGRELRLEVLEVLVEMAVADEVLKHEEQVQLRRIAKALSLTQDDYNAIQARHRDKLSGLS